MHAKIVFALLVTMCLLPGAANSQSTPDTVDITLTHPNEHSIDLRVPRPFFRKDTFKVSEKNSSGGSFEAINFSFLYPDLTPVGSTKIPVGDCNADRTHCHYYAGLSVAKPGSTVRYATSLWGTTLRDGELPYGTEYGLQALYPPTTENLLAYFYPPDDDFPSGVYISCIRASRVNIAGCRVFAETDRGLSVIIGGVKDLELHNWKQLVRDVSALCDSFVR